MEEEDAIHASIIEKLERMAERHRIAREQAWLESDGSPGANS